MRQEYFWEPEWVRCALLATLMRFRKNSPQSSQLAENMNMLTETDEWEKSKKEQHCMETNAMAKMIAFAGY